MHRLLIVVVVVATLLFGRGSCASDVVQQTFAECSTPNVDLLKCVQIRALKSVGRAMRNNKNVTLFNGVVDVVRTGSNTTRQARMLSDVEMQRLDNNRISEMLMDAAFEFLSTRVIHIDLRQMIEEGRRIGGGKKRNRFAGPFMAALAIKGVVMTMAYKGIAVMAGSALIIGKIALVLAAILGLKKLVSSDKEKTTVEIVKHPSYSSSHSHSSAYEEADGHYRRSMPTDEDIMILDNITRRAYTF